ncbi:NADH dehydrogenase [ubiquinone] 1 beta subcomplex subunit 1 isoform X1 [Paramormyrops kingsleyae]
MHFISSSGNMVNFASMLRDHWVNVLVPLGFVIGVYLDRMNDQKLTAFRNKSALYSRELKPGEEVTWK